jgi:chromosome segregation ATPase
MKKFFKTVFIVGLCGVGTIALAHAVLGKHRTHDAAKALQKMAQGEVDELIRKQKDMKDELSKLRSEYPKQIAMLKSQINQVDRQLASLDKEETRSADIIRLCEEDISYLEDQREVVGSVYTEARVIEHRGSKYNSSEAEKLTARIAETREVYVTRADDIRREREILQGERDQLALELQSVEAEQAEFEAEYQSLVREIERLERNEEMLKVAESRRGIGDDRHSEAMSTLNGVKSAVERARLEQEERLKSARVAPRSLDYETRAKLLELQRQREAKQKTERTPETPASDETEEEAEEELTVEFAVK